MTIQGEVIEGEIINKLNFIQKYISRYERMINVGVTHKKAVRNILKIIYDKERIILK